MGTFLRRLWYVIRNPYTDPLRHDSGQCQTCLARDDEGYQREKMLRIHDRVSARLWFG